MLCTWKISQNVSMAMPAGIITVYITILGVVIDLDSPPQIGVLAAYNDYCVLDVYKGLGLLLMYKC